MFTDYFFPELGGIQDSVATVARELGRRGHHVEIHAPRYGSRDYRRVGMEVGERDLGANVVIHRRLSVPFPSSTRQSRAALPSALGWAGIGRARPDVIHVHSFFGTGLEALAAGSAFGIPLIGTNHTTVAGFGPHIPLSVDRATAYVVWFYNRCDVVTAPSRSVFDELAGLTVPRHVISNPIDTALFTPARAEEIAALRGEFGLTGPVITYAGRLGAEKNIEAIIHAFARLRERGVAAQLAIAGHGSYESDLRALISDYRLAACVKFLGTLAQDALARLLRISDIFTLMSTSETQSMVVLQAMASGVPVVAAATRALPEFVGPATGVLVDPHDPAALAAAFGDLLAAPARRRALGAGGRAFAERHGIARVTDEWELLYRSLIHRRQAA